MPTSVKWLVVAFLLTVSVAGVAQARWQRWHGMQGGQGTARSIDPALLPPGTRVFRDVHYGDGALQTFDVYAPADARSAPVIFMVHGGGWRRGDKAARRVVQNKVSHWVPRGIIVVSVDYPMLPATPPLQQARNVAMALATAQRDAPEWGGDPRKFVLMGHSAGAHLVSLISAQPAPAISQGALPWLGTVALDSAAFNVATIMQGPHLRLYDATFGSDPAMFDTVSPIAQLHEKIAPFLAVCSSRRMESCGQAEAFAAKARGFGTRVEVLPQDLSHGAINQTLGEPSAYTAAVDRFLASLDPALGDRLR
jgi:acetyl esterase/lipase